jgi:hypothetical protein
MPYIFCESCGAGSYTNVITCPTCGRIARLARPRRLIDRGVRPDMSASGGEAVEGEVREMLYGQRSRIVELRAGTS